ncbi:PREDICTED: zymogen granule protein 16 homolog B [Chinchilla lanigera]|uniref:zymogen granule protein 16 homolog B n=1 Tax=Chinchilla lanigera TaxID=34839 RepID=UPI00038E970E|nr:PREDICTED: zymogen granule protein 16 homolog B [Chinchilla lanigera]
MPVVVPSLVCVGCKAKTANTAHPGASQGDYGDSPRTSPHQQLLPDPLVTTGSFLLEGGPQAPGAYKGQITGARVQDSQSRLSYQSLVHQPEVMLLLLTLALLLSPTCWAQVGKAFTTPVCNEAEIKGIRVAVNLVGNIISLQVKLGDHWDVVHGHRGGTVTEFLLDKDEYITEVHGSQKVNLRYLLLCTSHDRCAAFGKNDGRQFFAFPPVTGQVLKSISGLVGPIALKNLNWRWGDAQAQPTTAPANGATGTPSPA